MRTDTILYQMFRQLPTLFFALIGEDLAKAEEYSFDSVELKETAFRIDGVFRPVARNGVIYFLEVQFQRDGQFYSRLLSEIFLYFRQHPLPDNWEAVVLFAQKAYDTGLPATYQGLTSHIKVIHLDRLPEETFAQHPLDLLELLILPVNIPLVQQKARKAAERSQQETSSSTAAIDLIVKILLEKFVNLSFEEATIMISATMSDVERSGYYQGLREKFLREGKLEGKLEGKRESARTMLRKGLALELIAEITELSLDEIRSLTPFDVDA
jgi:predicted transposase/invertase (TIGR01784 family)